MAKCDLCGGDCKALELEQLLSSLQVEGVVDVCPNCRRWANDLKGSLLSEIPPKMREAIAARKGAAPAFLPGPTRWQRFKGAVDRFFSA